MNNDVDDTKYGRNWAGKTALCETCAYTGGYCLKSKMRFYKCKDYVREESSCYLPNKHD